MKGHISLSAFVIFVFFVVGQDAKDVKCVTNEDCKGDQACTDQDCVDPCDGQCGPHTVCHVINHVAMCSCKPGHSGHPILGCSASPDASGCSSHDQCPAFEACMNSKCSDPCENRCGDNTVCMILNHVPACACKKGYTGNPFHGCAPQGAPGTDGNHGKKRFHLETEKKVDWQEAFVICLRNNSRLASVNSREELEEIREVIRKTGKRLERFWTSGSDSGNEGDYIWASTGGHFTAESDLWLQDPPQPDNWDGKENCVEVWERFMGQGHIEQEFSLNDSACQHKNYFICEYYE